MKILLSIALLFIIINAHPHQDPVKIYGTITEKYNREPLISAVVTLYKGSDRIAACATDFDGNYSMSVPPDTGYILEISYSGKKSQITNINLLQSKKIDHQFESFIELEECIVVYKKPIIETSCTTQGSTISSKRIANLGNRKLNSIISKVSGTRKRNKNEISIRNSRSDATVYYLDGVKINGKKSKNKQSKEPPQYLNPSTEEYSRIVENDYSSVLGNELSTFSIDVDRASYSNIRRMIKQGEKVPIDAVRIEEMINYFDYSYPQPAGKHPYNIITEYTHCPWNNDNAILKIALQGKTIPEADLPPSHLTFLIDVSGSMSEDNKLPLVKKSLERLVKKLRPIDKVSMVVYAGSSGCVLKATSGDKKSEIMEAIKRLQSGGSTAGAAGIELAYMIAANEFIKDGNNRVILCTDGDFNVGISNVNELENLIEKKRKTGIYLSCLGFGMGNYKDNRMETLADKGNGNYSYIDSEDEAKKIFEKEFGGTLFTIAKDVKLQIEFNPEYIKSYRLVGYENRLLEDEDFKDDSKDAGEMGSGHVVTSIYELKPKSKLRDNERSIDQLRYSTKEIRKIPEIAIVKTRYKPTDSDKSTEYNHLVSATISPLEVVTVQTRLSCAVAMFGMLLRDSKFKNQASTELIRELLKTDESILKNSDTVELLALVDQYNKQ